MKISIVLPAKNESAAIGQTIAQIQQLQLAHEIIVVNDGKIVMDGPRDQILNQNQSQQRQVSRANS